MYELDFLGRVVGVSNGSIGLLPLVLVPTIVLIVNDIRDIFGGFDGQCKRRTDGQGEYLTFPGVLARIFHRNVHF
jgi:hypothetical protein